MLNSLISILIISAFSFSSAFGDPDGDKAKGTKRPSFEVDLVHLLEELKSMPKTGEKRKIMTSLALNYATRATRISDKIGKRQYVPALQDLNALVAGSDPKLREVGARLLGVVLAPSKRPTFAQVNAEKDFDDAAARSVELLRGLYQSDPESRQYVEWSLGQMNRTVVDKRTTTPAAAPLGGTVRVSAKPSPAEVLAEVARLREKPDAKALAVLEDLVRKESRTDFQTATGSDIAAIKEAIKTEKNPELLKVLAALMAEVHPDVIATKGDKPGKMAPFPIDVYFSILDRHIAGDAAATPTVKWLEDFTTRFTGVDNTSYLAYGEKINALLREKSPDAKERAIAVGGVLYNYFYAPKVDKATDPKYPFYLLNKQLAFSEASVPAVYKPIASAARTAAMRMNRAITPLPDYDPTNNPFEAALTHEKKKSVEAPAAASVEVRTVAGPPAKPRVSEFLAQVKKLEADFTPEGLEELKNSLSKKVTFEEATARELIAIQEGLRTQSRPELLSALVELTKKVHPLLYEYQGKVTHGFPIDDYFTLVDRASKGDAAVVPALSDLANWMNRFVGVHTGNFSAYADRVNRLVKDEDPAKKIHAVVAGGLLFREAPLVEKGQPDPRKVFLSLAKQLAFQPDTVPEVYRPLASAADEALKRVGLPYGRPIYDAGKDKYAKALSEVKEVPTVEGPVTTPRAPKGKPRPADVLAEVERLRGTPDESALASLQELVKRENRTDFDVATESDLAAMKQAIAGEKNPELLKVVASLIAQVHPDVVAAKGDKPGKMAPFPVDAYFAILDRHLRGDTAASDTLAWLEGYTTRFTGITPETYGTYGEKINSLLRNESPDSKNRALNAGGILYNYFYAPREMEKAKDPKYAFYGLAKQLAFTEASVPEIHKPIAAAAKSAAQRMNRAFLDLPDFGSESGSNPFESALTYEKSKAAAKTVERKSKGPEVLTLDAVLEELNRALSEPDSEKASALAKAISEKVASVRSLPSEDTGPDKPKPNLREQLRRLEFVFESSNPDLMATAREIYNRADPRMIEANYGKGTPVRAKAYFDLLRAYQADPHSERGKALSEQLEKLSQEATRFVVDSWPERLMYFAEANDAIAKDTGPGRRFAIAAVGSLANAQHLGEGDNSAEYRAEWDALRAQFRGVTKPLFVKVDSVAEPYRPAAETLISVLGRAYQRSGNAAPPSVDWNPKGDVLFQGLELPPIARKTADAVSSAGTEARATSKRPAIFEMVEKLTEIAMRPGLSASDPDLVNLRQAIYQSEPGLLSEADQTKLRDSLSLLMNHASPEIEEIAAVAAKHAVPELKGSRYVSFSPVHRAVDLYLSEATDEPRKAELRSLVDRMTSRFKEFVPAHFGASEDDRWRGRANAVDTVNKWIMHSDPWLKGAGIQAVAAIIPNKYTARLAPEIDDGAVKERLVQGQKLSFQLLRQLNREGLGVPDYGQAIAMKIATAGKRMGRPIQALPYRPDDDVFNRAIAPQDLISAKPAWNRPEAEDEAEAEEKPAPHITLSELIEATRAQESPDARGKLGDPLDYRLVIIEKDKEKFNDQLKELEKLAAHPSWEVSSTAIRALGLVLIGTPEENTVFPTEQRIAVRQFLQKKLGGALSNSDHIPNAAVRLAAVRLFGILLDKEGGMRKAMFPDDKGVPTKNQQRVLIQQRLVQLQSMPYTEAEIKKSKFILSNKIERNNSKIMDAEMDRNSIYKNDQGIVLRTEPEHDEIIRLYQKIGVKLNEGVKELDATMDQIRNEAREAANRAGSTSEKRKERQNRPSKPEEKLSETPDFFIGMMKEATKDSGAADLGQDAARALAKHFTWNPDELKNYPSHDDIDKGLAEVIIDPKVDRLVKLELLKVFADQWIWGKRKENIPKVLNGSDRIQAALLTAMMDSDSEIAKSAGNVMQRMGPDLAPGPDVIRLVTRAIEGHGWHFPSDVLELPKVQVSPADAIRLISSLSSERGNTYQIPDWLKTDEMKYAVVSALPEKAELSPSDLDTATVATDWLINRLRVDRLVNKQSDPRFIRAVRNKGAALASVSAGDHLPRVVGVYMLGRVPGIQDTAERALFDARIFASMPPDSDNDVHLRQAYLAYFANKGIRDASALKSLMSSLTYADTPVASKLLILEAVAKSSRTVRASMSEGRRMSSSEIEVLSFLSSNLPRIVANLPPPLNDISKLDRDGLIDNPVARLGREMKVPDHKRNWDVFPEAAAAFQAAQWKVLDGHTNQERNDPGRISISNCLKLKLLDAH